MVTDRRAFLRALKVSTGVAVIYAMWVLLKLGGERATQVFDDIAGTVVSLTVSIVIWVGAKRGADGWKGWRLISLAMFAWATGEGVWTYHEVVLGRDVPFPSMADIGYLAYVPLAGAGLILLPASSRSASTRLKTILDGAIVGLSLLGISWMFVLAPMYEERSVGLAEKVIGLAYPVGDVILITLSFMLVLRAAPKERGRAALLSLGFIFAAFSDTAFALMTLKDTYAAGNIIGIGWEYSFLLIGLSALKPGEMRAESEAPSRRRALLPYVPVLLLVLVVAASQQQEQMIDRVVLSCLVLVILAVTLRQLLAIFENIALNKGLEAQVAERTAELSAREQRFRALVTNSSDVVSILDKGLLVTYVTPSSDRVLGLNHAALAGKPLLDLVHPSDRQQVMGALGEALALPGSSVGVDCRIQRGSGGWCHAQLTVTSLLHDPAIDGVVVNIRDLTVRKDLEDQLRQLALHDPLTDLPNRALFADRVDHALARATRGDGTHAVVFIDLDGFKTINDGLGHSAGDDVLREVARRFAAVVRPPDTLARLGGDEFALLIEQVDPSRAEQIVHRLNSALSQPMIINDRETFVTMSAGIAISAGESADELLRNADVAMYTAKARGPGDYEFYRPSMHEEVLRKLEVEGDLRRAIAAGDLVLMYQPVVSLEDLEVKSVEALVRWNHLDRGIISPAEFIGLAEDTGLVVPLGRWVLRRACEQIRGMKSSSGQQMRVAVNISVRHLADPAILQDIKTALEVSGLDPASLTIEITESALMLPTEEILGQLEAIAAMGVLISIDDFGTGYSSLGYLGKFPLHAVKIDRSFITSMKRGPEDSAVVRAVISLSESFGLDTVAEGVEEESQSAYLKELGCTYVQGYLYGKPMAVDELAATVARSPALAVS